MLDIKLIRENPDKINELLKRRNPELSVDSVIKIDEDRRKIQFELDNLRATRKTESNKIGALKKEGKDTTELQAQIRAMGDDIKAMEEKLSELDVAQKKLFYSSQTLQTKQLQLVLMIVLMLKLKLGVNQQNLILKQKLTGIYVQN